ncbi:MAG: hypothetical protein P8K82_02425 [Paracoccaceae bacterium]|nr:hypothetical protein [Paracoccaceae bacterium]
MAALGNLAFTERDFAEARLQFGIAISLVGLEEGRLESYQKSYRIASNAVMALSLGNEEGRKVLDEMIAAGVKPNEVTLTTLVKKGSRLKLDANWLSSLGPKNNGTPAKDFTALYFL